MTAHDVAQIIARLDEQDKAAAETRRDITEIKNTASRVEGQVTQTNGRVTALERESIERRAREAVVKSELDARGLSRREYTAAALGAIGIGAVTLLLHLAGAA